MKYPFLVALSSYSPFDASSYRMHIFSEDRKQALGEFRKTEAVVGTTTLLLPKYVPRKQDGSASNEKRKLYFEKEYGSLVVSLPITIADFYSSLCVYVEKRVRADNLVGVA